MLPGKEKKDDDVHWERFLSSPVAVAVDAERLD
jgi:hypothetical protein